MATYCFIDRKRALFEEVCVHGWLAALLDFPKFKSRIESVTLARQVANALLPDVCCGGSGADYQYMVSCAFVASYAAVQDATEREIVQQISVLKKKPTDEALAFIRHVFATEQVIAQAIDDTYAQYLDAIKGHTAS